MKRQITLTITENEWGRAVIDATLKDSDGIVRDEERFPASPDGTPHNIDNIYHWLYNAFNETWRRW